MKTVTIHNLQDSTAQEVYDFIAHHLMTQREKATHFFAPIDEPTCRYRHEQNGRVLKCAAGCLIPDEDYKIEFDKGYSWQRFVETFFPEQCNHHIGLIESLQRVHDRTEIGDWMTQLGKIADIYNLTPYTHEPD